MDPVRTEGHEYEEPPSHTYLFLILGTWYLVLGIFIGCLRKPARVWFRSFDPRKDRNPMDLLGVGLLQS